MGMEGCGGKGEVSMSRMKAHIYLKLSAFIVRETEVVLGG